MSPAGARHPLHVPIGIAGSARPTWQAEVTPHDLSDDDAAPALAEVAVRPDSRVVVDVALSDVHDGVRVAGTVRAQWEGPCALCDLAVVGVGTIAVDEVFVAAAGETDDAHDHYVYRGDHLDLTPMVREAILLEMPSAAVPCPNPPLCVNLPDELRGRGAGGSAGPPDRPTGPPTGPATDPRWAPLDALRAPAGTGTDPDPAA